MEGKVSNYLIFGSRFYFIRVIRKLFDIFVQQCF